MESSGETRLWRFGEFDHLKLLFYYWFVDRLNLLFHGFDIYVLSGQTSVYFVNFYYYSVLEFIVRPEFPPPHGCQGEEGHKKGNMIGVSAP